MGWPGLLGAHGDWTNNQEACIGLAYSTYMLQTTTLSRERESEMVRVFKLSKPAPNNILPPTRLYFTLPNPIQTVPNWGQSSQTTEPLWDISLKQPQWYLWELAYDHFLMVGYFSYVWWHVRSTVLRNFKYRIHHQAWVFDDVLHWVQKLLTRKPVSFVQHFLTSPLWLLVITLLHHFYWVNIFRFYK